MEIESIDIDEYFKNRPTRDVFEKGVIDIITEKNKIITNGNNTNLTD